MTGPQKLSLNDILNVIQPAGRGSSLYCTEYKETRIAVPSSGKFWKARGRRRHFWTWFWHTYKCQRMLRSSSNESSRNEDDSESPLLVKKSLRTPKLLHLEKIFGFVKNFQQEGFPAPKTHLSKSSLCRPTRPNNLLRMCFPMYKCSESINV